MKPKDENKDTTCRKSTPTPITLRLTLALLASKYRPKQTAARRIGAINHNSTGEVASQTPAQGLSARHVRQRSRHKQRSRPRTAPPLHHQHTRTKCSPVGDENDVRCLGTLSALPMQVSQGKRHGRQCMCWHCSIGYPQQAQHPTGLQPVKPQRGWESKIL